MVGCGRRGWLLFFVLVGLGWGLLAPGRASAGDLLGWLTGKSRSHTAEFLGESAAPVTAPIVVTTPGRSVFSSPEQPAIPGVPSFAWGYFGAAPRRVRFAHDGYSGDESWWVQKRQ